MKSRITAGWRAIGAGAWMFAATLAATPAGAQSSAGAGPIILPGSITGSISPPASSAKSWTGEDGASGHPLMTAAAIREAAENFDQCIAGMWPEAARRRISRESFARFTADLSPDLRIMDFMDAQPEFTKAIWDYLDLLVSDARIQKGREILETHRRTFDAVEKAYGVDRYVIAAIWGIESKYSALIGDRDVLRSTATLACVGRRQAYFRDEFLSALEILHRGDLRPDQLRGSWAGAFGPTQFMPTSFKRFAVDFDGDGRRDVVSSVPDLVASTANNLKKDGWRAGQTWGYEVEVPAGFNYMQANRARQLTIAQWQGLGIRRVGGRDFPRQSDTAYLLAPAGARGPAFLMLPNFRAILRYNPADAYALAIGHFADRLRGGGPLVQAWPRHERVLSRTERLELQQILATRGYYQGEPDGRLGGKTVEALRHFQSAAGLPADGFASASVLERLRGR
jgi:lytic murein transglycosylase